ncbi:hypothetical protein [Niallia oryzisoli]|jgi:DNA-binding ferritin-like protein|uniref:hypothetical protein n=1 Tax=Niallia oryzisoli TaxID=1737571 RepID=UPI0037370A64
MAQATATATKAQEAAAHIGDSLFNSFTNGLDLVYTSRKEIENLFLQALETQKETYSKLSDDLSKIEAEQKKFIDEVREQIKLNIQRVFGPTAGKAYEQFNAQFDEVANRVQELTVAPYKEGLNLLVQSQEQFQQTIVNSIDQQQKLRQDLTEQVKASQKIFNDIVEANSKLALGLFK